MIVVKKIGSESIPQVQELATITWAVAYASILPPEQLSYMLDLFYSTAALQKQMEQGHQFILAADNDETIGFASYAPKMDSLNEPEEVPAGLYRLHKIYIDPNQQGKGIGKVLLDFIIGDIRSKGATGLELNVNRYNKALQFYQKFGFAIIKEEDIDIGNGYFMNDYVMKKAIF